MSVQIKAFYIYASKVHWK